MPRRPHPPRAAHPSACRAPPGGRRHGGCWSRRRRCSRRRRRRDGHLVGDVSTRTEIVPFRVHRHAGRRSSSTSAPRRWRSPAAPAAPSSASASRSSRSDAGPRSRASIARGGVAADRRPAARRHRARPLPGRASASRCPTTCWSTSGRRAAACASAGSTAPRASRPGRARSAIDGFCGFTLVATSASGDVTRQRRVLARPDGAAVGERRRAARSSPSAATGSTPTATRTRARARDHRRPMTPRSPSRRSAAAAT